MFRFLSLLCFGVVLATRVQASECNRPWPITLPNEPPAETQAMLELQEQVKGYLSEAEAYLACNKNQSRAASERLTAAQGEEDAEAARREIASLLSRHNMTVDEMHAVGDRFNRLVRAFRARSEPSND